MTRNRLAGAAAGAAWWSRHNLLKGVSVVAITAMASIGGANVAQAVPAYADAQLNFTNFQLLGIVDASGAPLAGITGLQTSVITTSDANYPGFPSPSLNAGGSLASGSDVLQATSGPGGFPGQNVFSQQLLPSNLLTPAGTRSDVLITGPIATGATSNLISEGKLSINGSAGSSGGSSTGLTATFSVATGTTVELRFNASSFLTTSVGNAGDSANAQVSATFSILNNTTNTAVSIHDVVNNTNSTNVAPGGLNASRTTLDPTAPLSFSSPLTFYDFTASLAPGNYTISLQDNTRVQLQGAVLPEPASLALLGAGLVGLGVARRRKNT